MHYYTAVYNDKTCTIMPRNNIYDFMDNIQHIQLGGEIQINRINFDYYSKLNDKIALPSDKLLPSTLTNMIFDWEFNQPVDNLPKSLTHLTFGFAFNQRVDNLPENLTHLTFGWKFNQPVDNLPKNLIYLKFDSEQFNQPANNLPVSLKEIVIYKKQEHLIKLPFGCKITLLIKN